MMPVTSTIRQRLADGREEHSTPRALTTQKSASAAKMLSGADAGVYQLPVEGTSSTEAVAGSKTSLLHRSWKSALRFSYISSKAAR